MDTWNTSAGYHLSRAHGGPGLRVAAWLAMVVFALVVMAAPAEAAKPVGGIDAVLVLDSSGSMRKTDPQRLRVPAARLFVSLLGADDRVAIISFSDNGYPVIPLTSASVGENRKQLLAAADRISSRGAFTNLQAAIESGRDLLLQTGDAQKRRMLILMSDGKMDVGDKDRDAQLVREIRESQLRKLTDEGIEVYTIAFTEASDLALMEAVAKETGGLFHLARNDGELHGVFSSIFESAKSPDMLPIEGGEFLVDDAVQEVNIVASKAHASVQIVLQAPDGTQYSAEREDLAMQWFVSQRFAMITLNKPAPGSWKILSSSGDDKAYVVTNMGLGSNAADAKVAADSESAVEAWLERDGVRIEADAILTNTDFLVEIDQPDGTVARFSLFDRGELGDRAANDGVYADTISFYKAGSHKMRVIAKAPTFQREKSVFFEVVPAAEATLETAAPEPEPVAEAEPEVVAPAAPEPAVVAEPESKFNFKLALTLFLLVNLMIGAAVALYFLLRKPPVPPATPKVT